LGLRSTCVADYLVVEPKRNPERDEDLPTIYLRVAGCGFDLIKESDLGTPDPFYTGVLNRCYVSFGLCLWIQRAVECI
jgi:hypothetical protein